MDHRITQAAAPLTNRAQLERLSEPWALNRTFAIICTMVLAVLLGSWTASGDFQNIILLAVAAGVVMIIVFVQDYWWAPPLIITAASFGTTALGIPMGGMEMGVVILAFTLPVKVAMKTLRKVQPEMSPGVFFWALLGYVAVHAIVIYFYNKIDGTPVLKNIVKWYYVALTPLVLYGLLIRYCRPHTVRPTVSAIFFTTLFTVGVSIIALVKGFSSTPFTDLKISVGWLDANGALGILRSTAPILFIGTLAFWPAVRPGPGKMLLAFAFFISALGTLVSGGRLSLAVCISAGLFFAVIRRRLWLAIPFVVITMVTSAVITAAPDLLYSMPESIQRALAPLNFSGQKTEIQQALDGSDEWHSNLRNRSIDYWMQDTGSFWVGHGYKTWDSSIDMNGDIDPAERERLLEVAIEMGLTENMFSSITNIFGLTGLILYGGFLISLAWSLMKACRATPYGSDARALCEFSLVSLLATLVFCAYMGSVPNLTLVYWGLGLLAARPYIAGNKPVKKARAQEPLPDFVPKSLRPVG
ncbi:MAG: hypothetical protein ABSE62_16725 [Chthoniobacteraceae bacterium]|jgi:hypothetical protein